MSTTTATATATELKQAMAHFEDGVFAYLQGHKQLWGDMVVNMTIHVVNERVRKICPDVGKGTIDKIISEIIT